MPMQMGWRWYGEGNDPITLGDIKQIPGVSTIVWALHDKMPGEIRSRPPASTPTLSRASTSTTTSRSVCPPVTS